MRLAVYARMGWSSVVQTKVKVIKQASKDGAGQTDMRPFTQ